MIPLISKFPMTIATNIIEVFKDSAPTELIELAD